ncbi:MULTISPECIES: H-NS histone family protein [Hydrogenophaga]|uniref:Nif11 domain-containing protein n=1 Tax=Hydrogenophaga electricum TaxID=1230953 RepID=A0ABQ6C8Z1_9BURK|nr:MULTISPECIES: H-NS histone family protein [Hydrogenophaga]GLS16455.1 hypothetical protein GCM10007935_38950 [Hydrogenophaga electricum]
MRPPPRRPHARTPTPPAKRPEPLSDHRFLELMKNASSFFAAAERDVVAERQAAIAEILALMTRYDLTLDDIAGD